MTLPDAAVVVREIFLVVGVEIAGEYVGVPAGVVATDEHVGVLAGVVVSPAGSGPLHTPLVRVTDIFTEPLEISPSGVAVEAVLTVRVLDTAHLTVATLVTAVTTPSAAPARAREVEQVAVVSLV